MDIWNARRLMIAASLGASLSMLAGCAKKDEEPKPANSDYYSGPVKEKPKQDNTKKAMPTEGGEK